MTPGEPYEIRAWGRGFWKWTCRLSPRTGRCSGIVGPPFGYEEAVATAQRHLADDHDVAEHDASQDASR